jgi:hypothetical protein
MKRLLSALPLLILALPAMAQEITYTQHIRPVWEDQCERCHGSSAPTYEAFMADPKKYEADDKGPRMDTYETLVFFLNSEKEAGALMRWCGLGRGGGSKPVPPVESAESPSGPSPKVGHPYRRRLNQKGERQS